MRKILPCILLGLTFLAATCNQNNVESGDQMEHKHTNHLIHESSPYLLQHAHNPVDWHPWGEEAFQLARDSNKMVIVSVGYSACHWCHVMEHETFEDSVAAAFMNKHFVNIKIDREERPDVDQVYMTAVQLITRRGGWPLSCITLPDGRPIHGGTYFPKDEWLNMLGQLVELRANSPEKLEEYATQLTAGIQQSELIAKNEEEHAFGKQELKDMVEAWSAHWDNQRGGPNRAPKFPLPNNYQFLMRHAHLGEDTKTLGYVETTLNEMARGGIYDQVGGGFARYSTDSDWKVPHFEKMLYDNAQLISLYSEAFVKTGNAEYKRVVEQTISFCERELRDDSGAYYSALDADSEGEEGKFYIWTEEELDSVLGDERAWAKEYFRIGNKSRWEGHHILLKEDDLNFARKNEWTLEQLHEKVDECRTLLLKARSKRIRPGLDDKSLTSWNALMIHALADASLAFGKDEYLAEAKGIATFIWEKQRREDGGLNHSYKNGKSTINGYLEDYSFTAEAYIRLYEASFDEKWLDRAMELIRYSKKHFYDASSGMFWFTSDLDPPLIARKQEITDNVIPASNSSLAKALFRAGTLTYTPEFIDLAAQMLNNIAPHMDYGQSYSNWGILAQWMDFPFYEIAITGEGCADLRKEIGTHYIPNAILLGGQSSSKLPLLEGKFLGDGTVFVCQNKTCQLPVSTISEALDQMK